MLKELLEKEKGSLEHFFDHFDYEKAEEIIKKLHACKGVIFLTGIGKSGIIAKKIAVTLISTRTKALFISPTNALHGDLGIVTDDDIFLLFSKSGESDELLNLIPFLRNKGTQLIAISSNPTSRLMKACDDALELPLDKELCPLDMIPTTSTTIQTIFGDLVAISLMHLKEFSLDDYAMDHPAGRIGKRNIIKVKDIMLKDKDIPLCNPKDKLIDTLVELSDKKCGCVLIVDGDQKLLGIFTDGDLRRALQEKGEGSLQSEMGDLMKKNPRGTSEDLLAWDAMKQMESDQKHPIMVMPVVDGSHRVLGVIKMHDLIQAGI